jgi:exopolysaccharide production protein ExoQ
MSTASMRSGTLSGAAPIFDKCIIIPIVVFAYCLIIDPLLTFGVTIKDITAPRLENRIFWPLVTVIALGCFVSRNPPRLTWPPHLVWFGAYLALAGASILWAFKPEVSFGRFATQIMLLASIILPVMASARTVDMMRGVFFCFALGSILQIVLIFGGYCTEAMANSVDAGYSGYFPDKNALGQFAAFAIILSLYEIFHPGLRRALGLIIIVSGAYLIFAAHSKAALACVVLAAILAKLVLFVGKKMRASPPIMLLPLLISYVLLSGLVSNLVNRISWHIFHNYDLSARTVIWDFVNTEIAKSPLLGWGYRSFWLAGSDSPSLVHAGGWVKEMPEAHNGYLDTILDTGYIGLVLFLIFIFTTLHAIGRVANRDPARAWVLLSIALFIILENFLESGWMRGGDGLWLMFVLVIVEAARYWQPFHRELGPPGGSSRGRPLRGRARFLPEREAPIRYPHAGAPTRNLAVELGVEAQRRRRQSPAPLSNLDVG